MGSLVEGLKLRRMRVRNETLSTGARREERRGPKI